MKSFLKKVEGGFKMALGTAIHPLILAVAGIGGFTGVLIHGLVSTFDTCGQVENTAIFQEIFEHEKDKLDYSLESGKLSQSQYESKIENLESKSFIMKVAAEHTELKEYDEKIKLSVAESFCSAIVLVVPFAGGVVSLALSANKRLFDSAKKDFNQAKRIKEMKDYKE